MHKFDKNPCMDFKGELCSERNATQRNATQRNATQRNATQRNANFTIVFQRESHFLKVLSSAFLSLCHKTTGNSPIHIVIQSCNHK